MDLTQGTVIERYTVEAILGSGGMATVYLVRHNQLGSLHAMKALSLPTPEVRKRLLQEGRVQSTLRHPNVVAVTDTVVIDGMPALVMEYVRGPTLSDFLAARKPSVAQADDLAKQLLRGVSAAHQAGLVHRDLKPANILLSLAGGMPVPKITDFGLAKVLRGEPGHEVTRSGVAMGTPAYMAPEQIRDAKAVDHRADLFSLGAVLYEIVAGRRAFVGNDTMELFQAVCNGHYVPLDEVSPKAPKRMVLAVEAALEVDVNARVQDCDALLTLWAGRKGPWGGIEPAWDQHTLFHVASLGSADKAASLPPAPATTDDRTFLFDTEKAPLIEEIAGVPVMLLDCGPQTFHMTEGRTVTLTRGLRITGAPVDAALWAAVTDVEGPATARTWGEAVAFCNRLSERCGLTAAYELGEPVPRKEYSLDDMGRMLYDLLPFDKIAPVLGLFGDDTLRVLQYEPRRLAEAEGIGPKTAKRIADRWDPWRFFTVPVALVPDAEGWRLPTEAEWAAFLPTDSGPWEWVFDRDPGPAWVEAPEPLEDGDLVDPTGPETGAKRLLRRGHQRRALLTHARGEDIGFRVVRSV